jgi:flagella basal body P-ring formation protein FlgA
MATALKFMVLAATVAATQGAGAQEAAARQDHAALRMAVEQFLQVQTRGLPGKVTVAAGAVDSRLNLPACVGPEAFLPGSGRAWGKVTVGVRCAAPVPWTIYLPATVRVHGDYFATAVPLAQGQTVNPADLVRLNGDLTMLPAGIVTDPSQAVGRNMSVSLPAGTPLRQDAMRSQQAVQLGQMVRLVSGGPGFQVSTEARAMNNANEGQLAQVRVGNGQTMSGVARKNGIVEVMF